MSTKLTSKGQVTVPKRVREALGLDPGSRIEFDVDERGRVVIRKAGDETPEEPIEADRFERARGRATVPWTTEELMRLLRAE